MVCPTARRPGRGRGAGAGRRRFGRRRPPDGGRRAAAHAARRVLHSAPVVGAFARGRDLGQPAPGPHAGLAAARRVPAAAGARLPRALQRRRRA